MTEFIRICDMGYWFFKPLLHESPRRSASLGMKAS